VTLSLRAKFLILIVTIVLTGIGAAGLYLSGAVKGYIRLRIESEMDRQARIATQYVEQMLRSPSLDEGHRIVHELGESDTHRVTLVLSDGTVIGDSSLNRQELDQLENHRNRPEVQDALKTGKGVAYRYSTTVERVMVYCGYRFSTETATGVVRVARAIREIDDAIQVLYGSLVVAAIILVSLAAMLAWLSAAYFARLFQRLVEYAQGLLDGTRVRSDAPHTSFEFGGLTTSLQALASRMEATVEELAMERDRFEAVLEGMSEAIIALDADRRVTVINPAAISLLEMGRAPLGRTLLETIRVPGISKMISELKVGEKRESEFEYGVGMVRSLLVRASRQLSGSFVVVLMDVTELRRLERIRRDFVANVSHELRTPVSVIRANAETLVDGALEDRTMALKFLTSIVTNAERLSLLISDLLDIARMEEGKIAFSLQSVTLAEAFQRVRVSLDVPVREQGHHLTIDVGDDLSVQADLRALDQVLFNLLDNAIKYTEPGGRIQLRGSRQSEMVIIEVEDDGPGIEAVHHERLFERFYRVDRGVPGRWGGRGWDWPL
jgi:two-component system, OmpR family, phosphate regulon sensor histidine kinase PhoR